MVDALSYKPVGHGFDFPLKSLNFVNVPNPSSHTMGLGFTQTLT
jgi:hypothetical protein